MAKRSGQKLPALESKVTPAAHLLIEWEAFAMLTTDRPGGGGPTSIPWSSVKAYAEMLGFRGDDLADFVRLISAMDGEFLAWCRERSAAGGGDGHQG